MSASTRPRPPLRLLLFALAGSVAGYLFYRFVGCPDGSCPLTGNPLGSTAYGTFIGLVVGVGLVPTRRG